MLAAKGDFLVTPEYHCKLGIKGSTLKTVQVQDLNLTTHNHTTRITCQVIEEGCLGRMGKGSVCERVLTP